MKIKWFAVGGAVMILVLCICSPYLLSDFQNRTLQGRIQTLEKEDESDNDSTLAEKIALFTESQSVSAGTSQAYVLSKEFPKKNSEEGNAFVTVLNHALEELFRNGLIPRIDVTDDSVNGYSFHLNTYIGSAGSSVSIWNAYLDTKDYALSLLIEDSTGKVIQLSCIFQGSADDSASSSQEEEPASSGVYGFDSAETYATAWAKYLDLELYTSMSEKESDSYHNKNVETRPYDTRDVEYYTYTDGETVIAYEVTGYTSGGLQTIPRSYDIEFSESDK